MDDAVTPRDHWEHCEGHVFFNFSSAFNTIQTSLLRVKLEEARVDCHLAVCLKWLSAAHGPQKGMVLSPFLFTQYTSDFRHNTKKCHVKKFLDDTVIVECVSEWHKLEYRGVIKDFVNRCELVVYFVMRD